MASETTPTDGRAVLYEIREPGIALLTLNRPERLNAWNAAIEREYFALLDAAVADPDVRVIVVTGAGKGYCAGADMETLQSIDSGETGIGSGPMRQQLEATLAPKPVIAAINGACAGLGLVQALMCDIRFAAHGAKFTTAFARRGLVAEYGLSWVLPRLVGTARALDLLMSARVFLAEEAAAMGLVNAVVPPEQLLDHTLAYAGDLAVNSSPTSMAVIKQQVYADATQTLAASTSAAMALMVQSFGRPDFAEGVGSYVQKRPPAFPPVDRTALST